MHEEAAKGCPNTAAAHMADVLASNTTVQQLRHVVQIPSLNSTEDTKSPTLAANICQNSPASPKADPYHKGMLKPRLEVQRPHIHNHHY